MAEKVDVAVALVAAQRELRSAYEDFPTLADGRANIERAADRLNKALLARDAAIAVIKSVEAA